jgi:hypothetical protein
MDLQVVVTSVDWSGRFVLQSGCVVISDILSPGIQQVEDVDLDAPRRVESIPDTCVASENSGTKGEPGQVSFLLLILILERSFRQLEIRWPRWVQVLPGYTVGSLGAFWTIQQTAMLLGIIS